MNHSSDGSADPLNPGNPVRRLLSVVGAVLAVGLAIHSIIVAYIGQYVPPEFLRAGILVVAATCVTIAHPLVRRMPKAPGVLKAGAALLDLALLCNLAYSCWNFLAKLDDIDNLIVDFSTLDQLSACLSILFILELTRRCFGLALAGMGLLVLLYCLFGASLPGFFRHSGFSVEQTVEIVWFGFQGVFGYATGIVVLLVFVFIVFGAVLDGTGAGEAMIRIALRATRGTRGGPGHAAIVSSAFFGMSSGSVTANVVGTGVITIPMIKKRGLPGHFAGAVEAAASTGGQLMPPVMGAAAFLMTQLAGVSYATVCIAALTPAILYYFSLFIAVDQEAGRYGLDAESAAEAPVKLTRKDWLNSVMFLVPLLAIITVLALGRSPAMAGFWAVISTLVAALVINPEFRRAPQKLFRALADGGLAAATIMIAVATIGLMIGVLELTGVGLKFATQIALLGDTSLFVSLLLAALACLILGMGMPTLPAYMIIVLVLGPAMRKLGVETLAIHMFVFYFGVLSATTPPVALSAVAAAPIARANPINTALTAMRLSIVGFIVPFVIVYEPSLLIISESFTLQAYLWVLLRLVVAIILLSSALSNYDGGKLGMPMRVVRIGLGIAMLLLNPVVQIGAVVAGVMLLAWRRPWVRRRFGATPVES